MSAALQDAADAPPEWKSAAAAVLIFSMAEEAAAARPHVPRELAESQLRHIKLLGDGSRRLSEAQRRRLKRIHAQALADAGRTKEAEGKFASLAKDNPNNAAIQEGYARVLIARGDQASLEKARAKWRELEKRSAKGSPRWFRAKYWVAWVYCELGNQEHAAKIISLLKLLHPDFGGPEVKLDGQPIKQKFEELFKRCGGSGE